MRAILLPLLLLACSGGEEAANNGAQQATTTTEAVPSNAMLDVQNRVVPLAPAASPSPVAASGLPAAFHGRWGLVEADCEPGRADAKGLMTVSADQVRFYESRGRPARVEAATPTRLVAELAMTGEGQQWTERARLTLSDGGRTLTRDTSDPAGSLRYTRCPA